MAIWDKVKQGIDKAGKAAQDVLDEGKLRIDAYRAREQADKAAEALGYAMFRAMESGHELESAARERLVSALRERETEAKRLETELANVKTASEGSAAAPDASPTTGGPAAGAASASATSATGATGFAGATDTANDAANGSATQGGA